MSKNGEIRAPLALGNQDRPRLECMRWKNTTLTLVSLIRGRFASARSLGKRRRRLARNSVTVSAITFTWLIPRIRSQPEILGAVCLGRGRVGAERPAQTSESISKWQFQLHRLSIIHPVVVAGRGAPFPLRGFPSSPPIGEALPLGTLDRQHRACCCRCRFDKRLSRNGFPGGGGRCPRHDGRTLELSRGWDARRLLGERHRARPAMTVSRFSP